jgi:hypothetical protein
LNVSPSGSIMKWSKLFLKDISDSDSDSERKGGEGKRRGGDLVLRL